MLQSSDDAQRYLDQGQTLFGEGWECVPSFDDLDEDQYEDEEEEMYVTMDLGTTLDAKALQNETQYQLIGLDTPLPFLKIGNQIFQGEVTPLIGDEVILGLVRNHDNPQKPSHPPLHTTNQRLTFRAITLQPRTETTTNHEPPTAATAAPPAEPAGHQGGLPLHTADTAESATMTGDPAQRNDGVSTAIDGHSDVFTHPSTVGSATTSVKPSGASAIARGGEMSNAIAGPSASAQSSHQPFLAPLPPTIPTESTTLPGVEIPDSAAADKTGGIDKDKAKGKDMDQGIAAADEADQAPIMEDKDKGPTTQTQADPGSGSGSGKPKRKWTKLAKVRVDDPKEFETLDLDSMKPHQSIDIGPNALEALGLPPSVPGLGVTLIKRELVKLLSGLPERGAGSRGGKGAKARAQAKARAEQEVLAASASASAQGTMDFEGAGAGELQGEGGLPTTGEGGGTQSEAAPNEASTQDSIPAVEGDVPMIDVEDDPPWQEIGDGDR
ncbi:hypothetical protein IAT40_003772 [Kwoniella sp. CBS 6097]